MPGTFPRRGTCEPSSDRRAIPTAAMPESPSCTTSCDWAYRIAPRVAERSRPRPVSASAPPGHRDSTPTRLLRWGAIDLLLDGLLSQPVLVRPLARPRLLANRGAVGPSLKQAAPAHNPGNLPVNEHPQAHIACSHSKGWAGCLEPDACRNLGRPGQRMARQGG